MAGRNPLVLPLAFTGALASLALLDPVRGNPRLLLSFVGAALVLGAWNAALAARTRRDAPHAVARDRPEEAALRAGDRPGRGAALLGLVLAAGVPVGPPHRRATAVRICLRHAARLVEARRLHARLRSRSRRLQHQPVSLVQAGLVLPAVCDGGARLRRQGADSLGQGRARRVHVFNPSSFPLAVCSLGAAREWRQRHHLGPGDREHPVLSAAHVSDAVSRGPARTVPLRRDHDDDVGGGGDVRVRPRCTSPRPASTSSTIRTFRSRSSSGCICSSPIPPRRRRPTWGV